MNFEDLKFAKDIYPELPSSAISIEGEQYVLLVESDEDLLIIAKLVDDALELVACSSIDDNILETIDTLAEAVSRKNMLIMLSKLSEMFKYYNPN